MARSDGFLAYNGLMVLYLPISVLLFSSGATASIYVAFMAVQPNYRFNPRWQVLEKRLAPLLPYAPLACCLGLVYLFSSGGMLWSALGEYSVTQRQTAWFTPQKPAD